MECVIIKKRGDIIMGWICIALLLLLAAIILGIEWFN